MTNRETFIATYTQAFADSYPQFEASRRDDLIAKALATALNNIRSVSIEGVAFKLTAKRLGLKHTYKAFAEYLAAPDIARDLANWEI